MGYSLARPVATHTTTERALCSCLCMPELRSASWCRDGDGRFAGEIDRKYSTRSRVRPVRPGPRPEHVGAGSFPKCCLSHEIRVWTDRQEEEEAQVKRLLWGHPVQAPSGYKEAGRTVHTATGHQPIPIPLYVRLLLCPYRSIFQCRRPGRSLKRVRTGSGRSTVPLPPSHRIARQDLSSGRHAMQCRQAPAPQAIAMVLARTLVHFLLIRFSSQQVDPRRACIGPTKKPDYKW